MSESWRKTTWRSPSNIALIKYWGKRGDQIPLNPSMSLTLKNAHTQTEVSFREKKTAAGTIEFQELPADHQKRILEFIEKRKSLLPGIEKFDLSIRSFNTFPDQAGIASSASGLSALALCLLDIVSDKDSSDFKEQASCLARLGSGSASRSIYGDLVVWGEHKKYPSYSNDYAKPIESDVHSDFQNMQNAILIVDSSKKKLSSSKGHQLMDNHSYKEARLNNVNKKFHDLHQILKSGDWQSFSELVIGEAWELHALMMLSTPAYSLLKPNTLEIIEQISDFKKQNKVKCTWTLDAGPNIHFLYAKEDESSVRDFIKNELESYTERILFDEVGSGSEKVMEIQS